MASGSCSSPTASSPCTSAARSRRLRRRPVRDAADGSHPYRLTTNSDPNDGAPYGQAEGVPYDNFHAYWSPNGRQVVWTHTEANPLSAGGETWSILLGDFKVKNGRPSLRNVRVVGKPYGAYETQPWSPDGKGFLFSAAGGYNSPFQAAPPGWGNMRVYYMRLYGKGASPARPRVTRIGDNAPFYEEQSIFTPDMRTVIMMSNRAATLGSWYGLVAAAAQRTGFDAPNTGSTQTLQFLADFNGPDFRSDLFAVDVRTKATRRLTFQNNVVPEFYWNHDYTKILWSLNGQNTASYTGRFKGVRHARRMVPKRTPRRPLRRPGGHRARGRPGAADPRSRPDRQPLGRRATPGQSSARLSARHHARRQDHRPGRRRDLLPHLGGGPCQARPAGRRGVHHGPVDEAGTVGVGSLRRLPRALCESGGRGQRPTQPSAGRAARGGGCRRSGSS